ncbi:hypothetical protein DUNSADRAFT_7761, partial [Dunaliella salina]
EFLDAIALPTANPPTCYDKAGRWIGQTRVEALTNSHGSKLKVLGEDRSSILNIKYLNVGDWYGYVAPAVSKFVWWSNDACALGEGCSPSNPYLLCGKEWTPTDLYWRGKYAMEEIHGEFRIDFQGLPGGDRNWHYYDMHYRAAVDDRSVLRPV